MKTEKIEHGGKTFAVIIRDGANLETTTFLTPQDYPLQVGFLVHKKGEEVKAHRHNKISRTVNFTEEVLIVQKGKMEIDFYDNDGEKIKSSTAKEGDIIILLDGGHGWKHDEDSKIVEVKQGPYVDVKDDKTYL